MKIADILLTDDEIIRLGWTCAGSHPLEYATVAARAQVEKLVKSGAVMLVPDAKPPPLNVPGLADTNEQYHRGYEDGYWNAQDVMVKAGFRRVEEIEG